MADQLFRTLSPKRTLDGLYVDGGITDYWQCATPVSGWPVTMFAWFTSDDTSSSGVAQEVMGIGDGTDFHGIEMRIRINAYNSLELRTGNGNGLKEITQVLPGEYSGELAFGLVSCAGEADTQEVKIFRRETGAVTTAAGTSDGGTWIYDWDRLNLCVGYEEGDGDTLTGNIYEAGVYDAMLTADEFDLLRLGVDPRLVRPGSLRCLWWPGDEGSVIKNRAPGFTGLYDLELQGGAFARSGAVPILRQRGHLVPSAFAAAAVGGVPAMDTWDVYPAPPGRMPNEVVSY